MTHTLRRLALVTALSVATPLLPTPVRAQTEGELAAARDLFQRGLEAAREGRWVDAREAFQASIAIAPRPNTWLNLAGAQAQTGRLVAAAASYRTFLELATSGREARYRAQATEALAALEPRIARLRIATVGLEPTDEVRIDDESVDPASLDQPVPVDPGRHVVTIVRDAQEVARQAIALGEGEARTIAMEVSNLPLPATPPPLVADATLPPVDERRDEGNDDAAVWIGVGIGAAVVVGVGVALAIVFASEGDAPLYTGNLGDGMIRF